MTPGPIVSRWNERFEYDVSSSSGLRWRVSTSNRVKVGDVAGGLNNGYYRVMADRRKVLVHRIVFEMMVGAIPDGVQIDHIDRNRANNRVENLRLVTNRQNGRNTRANTAHPGVCRHGAGWLVRVSFADDRARKYFSDHALAVEQARVWHKLADEHSGATVSMAMALLIKDLE